MISPSMYYGTSFSLARWLSFFVCYWYLQYVRLRIIYSSSSRQKVLRLQDAKWNINLTLRLPPSCMYCINYEHLPSWSGMIIIYIENHLSGPHLICRYFLQHFYCGWRPLTLSSRTPPADQEKKLCRQSPWLPRIDRQTDRHGAF